MEKRPIFYYQAQEAESRGDLVTMEKNRRTALYLNIGAVVTGVVTWILLIIIIAVRVAAYTAYVNNNDY